MLSLHVSADEAERQEIAYCPDGIDSFRSVEQYAYRLLVTLLNLEDYLSA